MHPSDLVDWVGTIVAIGICGVAVRVWYLALSEIRLTKRQIAEGALDRGDPVAVVARWNFTTACVHLFFALVLVWILVPLIPPTPRSNATMMAVGVPLLWLVGVSCVLVTDLKFRRRLQAAVARGAGDNVIPLRGRRRRAGPFVRSPGPSGHPGARPSDTASRD